MRPSELAQTLPLPEDAAWPRFDDDRGHFIEGRYAAGRLSVRRFPSERGEPLLSFSLPEDLVLERMNDPSWTIDRDGNGVLVIENHQTVIVLRYDSSGERRSSARFSMAQPERAFDDSGTVRWAIDAPAETGVEPRASYFSIGDPYPWLFEIDEEAAMARLLARALEPDAPEGVRQRLLSRLYEQPWALAPAALARLLEEPWLSERAHHQAALGFFARLNQALEGLDVPLRRASLDRFRPRRGSLGGRRSAAPGDPARPVGSAQQPGQPAGAGLARRRRSGGESGRLISPSCASALFWRQDAG